MLGIVNVDGSVAVIVGDQRFDLVSTPHTAKQLKKIALVQANSLERGSLEGSDERTVYQLVIP